MTPEPYEPWNPLYPEQQLAARRAETITRGELNDMLLDLANTYASNGNHEGDLLCNMLLALRERLL